MSDPEERDLPQAPDASSAAATLTELNHFMFSSLSGANQVETPTDRLEEERVVLDSGMI